MREIVKNIDYVKRKVSALSGKEFKFVVNHGRNKVETFYGRVRDVYPAIFTVQPDDGSELQSFSYHDILTHNVRFLGK